MAVIDVVKMDLAPGVFARKFPSQELSTWTQLIVSESQEAILLKEGQSVGPFGAGRHVLNLQEVQGFKSEYDHCFYWTPFHRKINKDRF